MLTRQIHGRPEQPEEARRYQPLLHQIHRIPAFRQLQVLVRLLVPANLPAADFSVLSVSEPARVQMEERLEEEPVYVLPVSTQEIARSSARPNVILRRRPCPESSPFPAGRRPSVAERGNSVWPGPPVHSGPPLCPPERPAGPQKKLPEKFSNLLVDNRLPVCYDVRVDGRVL